MVGITELKRGGYAESEAWEPWLIQPSPSYLETPTGGPIAIKQIEWIDIDTTAPVACPTQTLNAELIRLLTDRNINYAALANGITRIVLPAL